MRSGWESTAGDPFSDTVGGEIDGAGTGRASARRIDKAGGSRCDAIRRAWRGIDTRGLGIDGDVGAVSVAAAVGKTDE